MPSLGEEDSCRESIHLINSVCTENFDLAIASNQAPLKWKMDKKFAVNFFKTELELCIQCTRIRDGPTLPMTGNWSEYGGQRTCNYTCTCTGMRVKFTEASECLFSVFSTFKIHRALVFWCLLQKKGLVRKMHDTEKENCRTTSPMKLKTE